MKPTRFSDLKPGDEYIRIGIHPILLRDAQGRREGNRFIVLQDSLYPYAIRRMTASGREINLTESREVSKR